MSEVERMIKEVEQLNEKTPGGVIRDSDTILVDLIKGVDFEFSGLSQDIFDIWRNSRDKKAVERMFFEFTDMEFVDYLIKCKKEISRREDLKGKEYMDMLLVKPGKYPEKVRIGCELEELQRAVGGMIEVVSPFDEPVALVMDEGGKIYQKERNRALKDECGKVYDVVVGDFLVVGLGTDDFCSLSPDLMERFERLFHQPEIFVRAGRNMMAIPVPDEMVKE